MAEKTVNVEYVKSGKTYTTDFQINIIPEEIDIDVNGMLLKAIAKSPSETTANFANRWTITENGKYRFVYYNEAFSVAGGAIQKGIYRYEISELETVWFGSEGIANQNALKGTYVRSPADEGYYSAMCDKYLILSTGRQGAQTIYDFGYEDITVVDMTNNTTLFTTRVQRGNYEAAGAPKSILGATPQRSYAKIGHNLVEETVSHYLNIDLNTKTILFKEWNSLYLPEPTYNGKTLECRGFISPNKAIEECWIDGTIKLVIINFSESGYDIERVQDTGFGYFPRYYTDPNHNMMFMGHVGYGELYIVKNISAVPFNIELMNFSGLTFEEAVRNPETVYGVSQMGNYILLGAWDGAEQRLYLYNMATNTVSDCLKYKLYPDRAGTWPIKDYYNDTGFFANAIVSASTPNSVFVSA